MYFATNYQLSAINSHMPLTNQQFLIAYVIPGAIGLIVAILAWRPWSSNVPRGAWGMPVAMGIGMAVGMVGLAYQFKPPGWPPQDSKDWLFHAALVVVVLGLIDALLPLWGEVRSLLWFALAATVSYLLIWRVADRWPPAQLLSILGGIAMAMTAGAMAIERTSERSPGWIVPAILLLSALGVAPWPLLVGSADLSFRAGILVAMLVPWVIVAAWSKKLTLSPGGAFAFALFFGPTLLTSYALIADVPAWQAIVLAAAPIVGLLPLWLPVSGWKRPALSLGLVIALLLAVQIPAYLAWKKLQESPEAYWR